MNSANDARSSTGEQSNSRSVVRRTVQILDAFTTYSRWGVRELATHFDVPKSGLHRTLQELAMEGLLSVDEEGSYSIGAELLHLASGLMRSVDITKVAYAHLLEARNACGETAILVAYEAARQQIIAIDSVDTLHPVQFPWGALRQWTDIHLSASGKAILAFLPEDEIERYLSVERKSAGGDRVDAKVLKKELAAIRARGWALSHGERIPGTGGTAAPVFDARGIIVGGVVIAWPDRLGLSDDERFGITCANAAGSISADLGWKAEVS